jgi:hypothetical protein
MMLPRERGTIIFSGATGSIRGVSALRPCRPKVRSSRIGSEYGPRIRPRGLHVAHVIIDGMIGQEDGAEPRSGFGCDRRSLFQLYRQQRSA